MQNRINNKPALPAGAPVLSEFHEMRQPLVFSALFHLSLILIGLFGLELLPKKAFEMPTPISVSMVKPSDIARTNNDGDPSKEDQQEPPKQSHERELPKPASSAPPPPPPPPVQEKVEAPPPPPEKLAPPPPVPMEKPVQPIEKLTPVQPTQQAETKPQPKLPPLQQAKALPPKPPVQQQKNKNLDADFNTLLNNVAPAVEKADTISKDPPVRAKPKAASHAMASNDMTADEMARVRQQLAGCWVIPAGAVSADKLSVDVQVDFNPDRTLRGAQLLDSARYNADPYYRAAADSVMRALHNPACNPLDLPPDKYDFWRTMTITFNPKEMLGL